MANTKGFYNVIDTIKAKLIAEPFVNTVTTGNIDDIDLSKQTIYPLSHITVNNTNIGTNTLVMNISIFAMDVVDESKLEDADFIGNDNEQDVLNTQLMVLNRVITDMQRGDLYSQDGNMFQVEASVSCEPFVDRFENKLAGWVATFDIVTINDMTIC